jgi:hypothetical protein
MATACKRKDAWYFHSDSRTTDGVWVATEPFLKLAPDASPASIGKTVLSVLEASQTDVPHPKDWNAVYYPIPEMAGVKSWTTFMKGSMLLTIEADGGVLVITPTKNLGPKEGHVPFENRVLRLPEISAPDVIGAAIQDAIAQCE